MVCQHTKSSACRSFLYTFHPGFDSLAAIGKHFGTSDDLVVFGKIAFHDIEIQRVDQIQLGTTHRRDVEPGLRFKAKYLGEVSEFYEALDNLK